MESWRQRFRAGIEASSWFIRGDENRRGRRDKRIRATLGASDWPVTSPLVIAIAIKGFICVPKWPHSVFSYLWKHLNSTRPGLTEIYCKRVNFVNYGGSETTCTLEGLKREKCSAGDFFLMKSRIWTEKLFKWARFVIRCHLWITSETLDEKKKYYTFRCEQIEQLFISKLLAASWMRQIPSAGKLGCYSSADSGKLLGPIKSSIVKIKLSQLKFWFLSHIAKKST